MSGQKILEKLIQMRKLKDNENEIESIDNLRNKRVRSVGELLKTQIRFSLKNITNQILKNKYIS